MSVLAKGTQVYFMDPDDNSVVKVDCVTGANPGGAPRDTISAPCLEDDEDVIKKGIRRFDPATLTINPDGRYDSHVRLHELFESPDDVAIKWVIGWADGIDTPPEVDSNGDWDLPPERTWFAFEGWVQNFPFDHQLGAVVAGTVTIQRTKPSGAVKGWHVKEASS